MPTLDGPVTIRVKPGTQSGTQLRVAGKGVKQGALIVTLDVQVPASLTDEQREAIERLAAVFPEDPRAAFAATAGRNHDGT